MVFFDKEEEGIQKLINRHFELVEITLSHLNKTIQFYLKNDRAYKDESFQVHKMEHEADITRREVELKLCEGKFLPMLREDYVNLIERVDLVANKAEAVADFLVLTRLTIPDEISDRIIEMTQKTLDMFPPLKKLFALINEDMSKVLDCANKIENMEQEIDKIQWYITEDIFKMKISLGEKLLLKEFIDHISVISNRIEDASDMFILMAVKTRL